MCCRNADRHGCVPPQHSWPDAQTALRVAETLLRHARRTKTRETVGNKIARRRSIGRIAALFLRHVHFSRFRRYYYLFRSRLHGP